MDKFSETYKLSKPLQEVDNLNRPKRSKGIVLVFSSVSHSVMSDSPCPQTVAHQPPLSMEFSKQGYWSGLPFPSPGDLPDTGIEPWSLALQADSLPTELQGKPIIVTLIQSDSCLYKKRR